MILLLKYVLLSVVLALILRESAGQTLHGTSCTYATMVSAVYGSSSCDGWSRTSMAQCIEYCRQNVLPSGCSRPAGYQCSVVVWDNNPDWPPGWCQTSDSSCVTMSASATHQLTYMTPPTSASPTAQPTTIHPSSAAPTQRPSNHPTPHVCHTQLHGCDSLTTYCQANPNGGATYTCVCREGYMPTSTSQIRCIATPSPTHTPSTRTPTIAPSTSQPTVAPTSNPTSEPTPSPTTPQPTATPTSHPTPHVCNTQLHGCDLLTTYCQENPNGGAGYVCECRRGYAPTDASQRRCIAAQSPTDSSGSTSHGGTGTSTGSTITYSVLAVVVVCVLAIVVMLAVRKPYKPRTKHRRELSISADSHTRDENAIFANPVYETSN